MRVLTAFMPLVIHSSTALAAKKSAALAKFSSLIGRAAFFSKDGQKFVGQVESLDGDKAKIKLALPDPSTGILLITDSLLDVQADELETVDFLTEARKIRHFEADTILDGVETKFTEVKKDTATIDYVDVRITGYASTFVGTTKADRDGDYIMNGAFREFLPEYKTNPVILIDHRNSSHEIAGSFDKISEDTRGLAVDGRISNAPGLTDIRFKLVEKHLKTLSIGGLFYFIEDGRGIEKVRLFEVSLVAVPSNQDALFQVRGIDLSDMKKAYAAFRSKGGQFKIK